MEKLNFKRIGILIGATLLISIGVQAWRMYAQFEIIQSQLVSDIQESLDNAIESYFVEIAKTDIITLNRSFSDNSLDTTNTQTKVTQINIGPFDNEKPVFKKPKKQIDLHQLLLQKPNPDSLFWYDIDSTSANKLFEVNPGGMFPTESRKDFRIMMSQDSPDSVNQLEFFTSKIIVSFTRDSLDFDKINCFLQEELGRRGIEINYQLFHSNRKPPLLGDQSQVPEPPILSKPDMPFMTVSRSTFLPPGQSLELYFENTAETFLKRGVLEIATSLAFLGIIAFAFYYLYQTIKNQKEIAEIKEDLIGNITHEFKTPIATTLSAIEGIELFNPENDPKKVKKYLGISKMQMHKLNQMVEKLLETATLDSEQLVLKKESIDPEPILRNLLEKFRTLDPEKETELILPTQIRPIVADPFHFENVISNLLDNALKYGGNQVRISLDQSNQTKIKIWDDGGKIGSEQKELVFEQFYRIPQGNIHDVKGFGIGLYYVKKIIEKHGGKIELETAPKSTTFITIWP